CSPPRATSAMRRALAAPLTLVVAAAATGWLYVFRPGLPGPRIGEALPLDELAKHSSEPLLWFVLVWAGAATLLGSVARWARMGRFGAAVGLAVTVGLWTYFADGASIAVVRQIPARDAFDTASHLQ